MTTTHTIHHSGLCALADNPNAACTCTPHACIPEVAPCPFAVAR